MPRPHPSSTTSLTLVFLTLGTLVTFVCGNDSPRLLNVESTIIKSEDTPLGTIISSITAADSDGPKELVFSIVPNIGADFVELSAPRGQSNSASGRTVDIILKKELDRDYPVQYPLDLVFKVDDNPGGDGNVISVRVSMYIKDVNDEHPSFQKSRYRPEVYENVTVGTNITTVKATDPDGGTGGHVTYSISPAGSQDISDDYTTAFRIDPSSGVVYVNHSLDFDQGTKYYEYIVTGTDGGGLTGTANLDIKVRDIQDSPPTFFNLPYSVTVNESVAIHSQILQLVAADGDREQGVANEVTYSFVSGDRSNFDLDTVTGWITVKSELDRDATNVSQRGGVYAITVKATEVDKFGQDPSQITATTLVTITVNDVNDNAPTFTHDHYEATVLENMQAGVPITFVTSIRVKDIDMNENSHFMLLLEKDGQPYTDFSSSPSEVFSESTISIRVQNSADLDFEKTTNITFTIVAREMNTYLHRSGVATVTVHILDVNDNRPQFTPATFPTIEVPEDAAIGTEIIILRATDDDKNDTIWYFIRGSDSVFQVNNLTGNVTLASPLDRETIPQYTLPAEARDDGGYTAFTNLNVKVTDVNDNDPQFRRQEYYAAVREDSLTFVRESLVVEADDGDEKDTNNSLVKYRIDKASGGLESKFKVNDATGEITLTDLIDYESLDSALGGRVTLQVVAYDQGVPSLSSAVNVTIQIEDVNDNAPMFNQSKYTTHIKENTQPRTLVLQVFASDLDSTKPNNEFLYRIDSGAGDKFRINFQTGEITVDVGAKLDKEDNDFYVLNVSATDRGAIPLGGFCQVEITIDDVNDEPPTFTPSTFTKEVSENLGSGTGTVITITAQDPDTDSLLSYSILTELTRGLDEMGEKVNVTETGVDMYFDIHNATGGVYIKSKLDRETVETIVLDIFVRDLNAEMDIPHQTATATLTITLLDYNDHRPEFQPTSTYSLKISEGLEANTDVLRLETTDQDKNQMTTYTMGTNPLNNFDVNPTTGVLKLLNQLDRETQPLLQVTVFAHDNGNPVLSSTATIDITVQDVNDNNPIFYPYHTVYTVKEDDVVNTTVATISASDADLEDFGTIIYTLDVTSDDHHLKIDRNTGEISVAEELDRETQSYYTLFVIATDNPGDSTNQRRNQTKVITVNIEDVNDKYPYFTNVDDQTHPQVLENAVSGNLVFTVSAEDEDIGDNARLDYVLTAEGDVDGLFLIDTVEKIIGGVPKYVGDIKVNGNLLEKVGDLAVTVKVTDRGETKKSAVTTIHITVQDVNRHPPEFVTPKGPRASIYTMEEEPAGTLIIQISASDEDHGQNAVVTYELQQEADSDKFLLDLQTGTLTNRVRLDREAKPSYEIKIQAIDNGTPNRLFSTLTLIINLLDTDDSDPIFTREHTPYRLYVEEERTGDQSITDLSGLAHDPDNQSVICYYIVGGDPEVSTNFFLNQSGFLATTQKFDRESIVEERKQPYINMLLWATSRQCRQTIPTDLLPSPGVQLPDGYMTNTSLLWVQVQITDINDNPPEFKQSVLTFGVTRDTGYGITILSLQDFVTDKDETMAVEFQALLTEQHLESRQVTVEPFMIHKNGSVVTNTYFQANMYGYFLIYIQAREDVAGGDTFIANATLRISLINDDQRVKVVFKNRPELVRAFQVTFTMRLQNTTGYRIVVDKIQTHENRIGQPEVNKTDMFIHGEDMKTNVTISASELLRVIDSYAEALLGLRYDYKVLEIVPTVVAAVEDDLENVFRMALILVSIGLTLLCVAIAIIFYLSRQRYKRKLKAATAMAYGSEADLQKLEMPGTNLHTYENTNPIYLEKVQLEVAGEQDDDDSLDDNAVDNTKTNKYSEQQKSMNFYTEANDLDKVAQSKLGTGDAILNAALQLNEGQKQKNVQGIHNGYAHINHDFEGLPSTEI